MDGITEWKTPQGIHVLSIHYSADEEKRSEDWAAEQKKGMTEQAWQREYEINFDVYSGRPWYPEFRYDFHVAKEPLQSIQGRPVGRFWDYGLTPATAFAQTTAKAQMLILYPELQSVDCGITAHGAVVKSESGLWFPGCQFVDFGDPAGNQRAQTDEKSCNDILRDEYGINVQPGPVSFTTRDEALRTLLTGLTPDGQPRLLIDPRCSHIIAAFRGGYQRREVAGVYMEEPEKNMFSHIMDAIQYGAAMIFGATDSKPIVNRKQGGFSDGRSIQHSGYRRGYQTR